MISRLLLMLLTCAVATAEDLPVLRVMTWNLHHGEGLDGKIDLERIAKRILEEKPDLVALQEMDQKTRRCGGVDQAAELAKLTGMSGVFGAAMDYDGGAYGQAILSKFPIERTQIHRLPGGGEPRIAFEAKVRFAGKPLRILTVHLDAGDEPRRVSQAQALVTALSEISEPMVLAGDFNDVRESKTLAAFAESWREIVKKEPRLTFPADKPQSEIDHFFAKGLTASGSPVVVADAIASDHRPVTAAFSREKPQ